MLGAKEENRLRRAMSDSELGTAATETQRWSLMNDLYDTQLQASQLRAQESSDVLKDTEQQARVLTLLSLASRCTSPNSLGFVVSFPPLRISLRSSLLSITVP